MTSLLPSLSGYRYSQEAGLSGLVTNIQAFVPWSLDAARLRVDESYRLEATISTAQRDDPEAWKAACIAAEVSHGHNHKMGHLSSV